MTLEATTPATRPRLAALREFWYYFSVNRGAVLGLVIFLLLILVAIFAPVLAPFTPDQQFFISYAQAWRWKAREPALRNRVLTDGHAPSQYRALTVRNLDPWYAAFDVGAGDKLYLAPADRVRVW